MTYWTEFILECGVNLGSFLRSISVVFQKTGAQCRLFTILKLMNIFLCDGTAILLDDKHNAQLDFQEEQEGAIINSN